MILLLSFKNLKEILISHHEYIALPDGLIHLVPRVEDVPLVITVHHSLYVDVSDTKQLLRVKILSGQNAKYARYSILNLTSSVFLNLNKKLGGLVSETTL